MIIIQFHQSEKAAFENIFDKESYDSNYVEAKKLSGDEILLQVLLTATSVVSPFIIQFFLDQRKKDKSIKIIRKGVELTFENENDLKVYLESLQPKNDNTDN